MLEDKADYSELLYRESLAIRKASLGDHPDVAASLNNLALLLKEKGENEEAFALGNEALRICENTLGPSHPTTEQFRITWAGTVF